MDQEVKFMLKCPFASQRARLEAKGDAYVTLMCKGLAVYSKHEMQL